MGIYLRGRVWWIDYYDQHHQRVQESSNSPNRRDAQDLFNVRQSEVSRGVFKRPVKIAFGEFGKKYMEYAKANKRSWLRDEQMLKQLEEFFGKEHELAKLGVADIEAYKVQRRLEVSGSTVNRELALLKRMFNLAIDWDLLVGRNPVCKVKFFKEFSFGSRVLTQNEEERLIENAAPFIQDLIVFGLNTGLRVGEIFSLRWSNVDMEKNILNVFAHKTWKTRAVPMNTKTPAVVEAWALHRKNDLVFYNTSTGQPFVDLRAGFRLACRKAGISDVSWHTLRHTFASRLIERGVDIVTVQQLLGHSTVTVTMRYTHTNLASKAAAVAKLVGLGDTFVTVAPKCSSKIIELSQTQL